MTRKEIDEVVEIAPRRLIEGNDRAAVLIEDALASRQKAELDFPELLAARQRRASRKRVEALLVVASVPLAVVWWAQGPNAKLSIAPEIPAPIASAPEPERKAIVEQKDEADVQEALEVASRASKTKKSDSTPPTSTPALGPLRRKALKAPSPQQPESRPPAGQEERCSDWTIGGKYEVAVSCYERKAQGVGVAAEWALLEKARLQNRALGSSKDALETLNEYEQRFPEGVLAREARLKRIELLTVSGRGREALETIDHTLAHDQVPERTGELFLLRAELRSELGDCARALGDLAESEAHGVSSARTQAVQERCRR